MILDKNKTYDFFVAVSLFSPAIILEKLVPKEILRTEYKTYNSGNAKNFLLLKILTEQQKIGVKMDIWSNLTLGKYNNSKNLKAQFLDSYIDEQSLHQRKLFESLVLLINFCQCNSIVYFYHFLLLQEFNDIKYKNKEYCDFFGVSSNVIAKAKSSLLDRIDQVEKQIPDFDKCFYLQNKKSKQIKSNRQLFLYSLKYATEREKAALNYTYDILYGRTSKKIHLNFLNEFEENRQVEEFRKGFLQCGLFSFYIIRRSYDLIDQLPSGINIAIMKHDENDINENILNKKKYEIGDFVVTTTGLIGQIIKINISKFGYISYLVEYLYETPSYDISENWYSQLEIALYIGYVDMVKKVKNIMSNLPGFKDKNDFEDFFSNNINDALRKTVNELWTYGIMRDENFHSRIIDIISGKV